MCPVLGQACRMPPWHSCWPFTVEALTLLGGLTGHLDLGIPGGNTNSSGLFAGISKTLQMSLSQRAGNTDPSWCALVALATTPGERGAEDVEHLKNLDFNGSFYEENQIKQRKLYWFVAIEFFSTKKWEAAPLMVWHIHYRKGDAAHRQSWRSVLLFSAESLGFSMDEKRWRERLWYRHISVKGKIIFIKRKKKKSKGCINPWPISRQCLLQECDTKYPCTSELLAYFITFYEPLSLIKGYLLIPIGGRAYCTESLSTAPHPCPQSCFLNHAASPSKPGSQLCAACNTAQGHLDCKLGHSKNAFRKSVLDVMISVWQTILLPSVQQRQFF